MKNAFTILPYDVCGETTIEAFPDDQDCTNYNVLHSQICGLIIVPVGANKPTNWQTLAGWSGVIDNGDQTGTKGRYLAGIGSLLPAGKKTVELGGGRREIHTDRRYRLTLSVNNYAPGHIAFTRMLEGGYRNFDCWMETLGGRIIGGAEGVRPFVPDGEHLFDGENTSVETMRIVLDFFFPGVP